MHDIAFSNTGDLIPNSIGGLNLVDDHVTDLQDINYRVKTNNPEHLAWSIGANLEDLVGLQNSIATGDQGNASIIKALTTDARFNPFDINCSATPISSNQIEFAIGITDSSITTTQNYYITVVNLGS